MRPLGLRCLAPEGGSLSPIATLLSCPQYFCQTKAARDGVERPRADWKAEAIACHEYMVRGLTGSVTDMWGFVRVLPCNFLPKHVVSNSTVTHTRECMCV